MIGVVAVFRVGGAAGLFLLLDGELVTDNGMEPDGGAEGAEEVEYLYTGIGQVVLGMEQDGGLAAFRFEGFRGGEEGVRLHLLPEIAQSLGDAGGVVHGEFSEDEVAGAAFCPDQGAALCVEDDGGTRFVNEDVVDLGRAWLRWLHVVEEVAHGASLQ